MECAEVRESSTISSTPSIDRQPNFIELNKELEKKVNNLMNDVDSILSKQIDIMRNPKSHLKRRQQVSGSKTALKPIVLFTPENIQCNMTTFKSTTNNIHENSQTILDAGWNCDYENIVEKTQSHPVTIAEKLTTEPVIRFFKAQITKLQSDLQAIQREKKKLKERCKDLQTQFQKQEEIREKLLSQQTCYRESIMKTESANSDMRSKLQAQSTEILSLRKEIENLEKKLKSVSQLLANNELRLNRSLEENEKLKSSLKVSQTEEKESRDYIRKTQEEKRIALKILEKQRTEIFQAFKKQTQLVNNLKKQKVYLETHKEIQFIEKDFTKLLEWKLNRI